MLHSRYCDVYVHVTRSQLQLKRARCKISNKGYLSLNIFVILCHNTLATGALAGADPGFDQGGAQIVTGLKLPFWGLSFVEFWCWGLIFGGQGGPGPPEPPPGSAPVLTDSLQ